MAGLYHKGSLVKAGAGDIVTELRSGKDWRVSDWSPPHPGTPCRVYAYKPEYRGTGIRGDYTGFAPADIGLEWRS